MSTKPVKRYGRRPALSILAAPGIAALAGLGAAAGALADGVVVESSSSSHAVGERIEDGGFVAVEDGAEVAVLDRSGVVTRIEGPGELYDSEAQAEEDSAAARGGAVAELAVSLAGLGRRAGLATSRGGGAECEATPEGSRSAPSPACAWTIALETDFEGYATCDAAGADGTWRRLDLGGEHGGASVEAGDELAISSEDGASLAGLAPGEDVAVRCQAVDAATWALLAPAWRADYDAEQARALMESFAAVSGGRFAEASEE